MPPCPPAPHTNHTRAAHEPHTTPKSVLLAPSRSAIAHIDHGGGAPRSHDVKLAAPAYTAPSPTKAVPADSTPSYRVSSRHTGVLDTRL